MPIASPQFYLLVATLLDGLAPPVSDTALAQLYAVFGPMLTSALQLVDRRDVVRIELPGGRFIHQVTSSSGSPYTLYLSQAVGPSSQTPGPRAATLDREDMPVASDRESKVQLQPCHRYKIQEEAEKLKGLFCPCPGFAFGSLTGERNVFCKHILAILVAHRLGKVVETRVAMAAVAGLLGLSGA